MRHLFKMLLIMLLLGWGHAHSSSSQAAQIRIHLPSSIPVTHGQVALNDIAELTTSDAASLRVLMNLPLGNAPYPGTSTQVSRTQLQRWLRARLGERIASNIEWSGAEQVELQAMVMQVSSERFLSVARQTLEAWLKNQGARYEIGEQATPNALALPDGTLALRPRPFAREQELATQMTVWVEVWVDERFVRVVPVSFNVSVYRYGWVAPMEIKIGTAIDLNQFAYREIDVARYRNVLLDHPDSHRRWRLRRSMAAGTALTRAHIEPIPNVTRGSAALLKMSLGAVALETPVEVLQDGQFGQLVRVRLFNTRSTTPLLARVAASDLVEIRE